MVAAVVVIIIAHAISNLIQASQVGLIVVSAIYTVYSKMKHRSSRAMVHKKYPEVARESTHVFTCYGAHHFL